MTIDVKGIARPHDPHVLAMVGVLHMLWHMIVDFKKMVEIGELAEEKGLYTVGQ